MSNPEQVQEPALELETTDIQQYVALGESLKALRNNPDFKRVILDGYLKDKAMASVSMLSHEGVKRNGDRPAVMEDLVAISNLSYYFDMIENFYHGAVQDLQDEEGSE